MYVDIVDDRDKRLSFRSNSTASLVDRQRRWKYLDCRVTDSDLVGWTTFTRKPLDGGQSDTRGRVHTGNKGPGGFHVGVHSAGSIRMEYGVRSASCERLS